MNKPPFLSLVPPVIILSNPQLGENIGASARAMKNCGFTELRLINPRDGWPNSDAEPIATHAVDILENTNVYKDLASSCFDITHLFATTARPRELKKSVINPRMAAQKCVEFALRDIPLEGNMQKYPNEANGSTYKAAYLFGSERMGLTNDEIVFADFIVEANLNPGSNSLNLAQAVMIMCWEFVMIAASPQAISKTQKEVFPQSVLEKVKQKNLESAATIEEQKYFFDRFEMLLESKGFFTAQEKAPTVKRNLKNFFIKARFTKQEILTWHGILTLFSKQK